jgi:hypothetical protein
MSRFIKLDAAGNNLPDDATEFFLTLNTETGFVTPAEDLFPKRMTHDEAKAAIKGMNDTKYGGRDNWTLGKVRTHVADLDYSRYAPAIDTSFYPSAKSDWVWTEETYASSSGCAWLVGFGDGFVDDRVRDDYAFVRAVSGPAPAGQ